MTDIGDPPSSPEDEIDYGILSMAINLDQKVVIGDHIELWFYRRSGTSTVRVSIRAPKNLNIRREKRQLDYP